MRRIVPNFITCINIMTGCIGMVLLMDQQYGLFLWIFGIGLIADLLDGAVARALKASSEMGKQLDSLADMISFGFLPGFLLYLLLKDSLTGTDGWNKVWPFLGFLVTIASAIRLGRFNIEEQNLEYFKGMPTPANALWIIGLFFILENGGVSISGIDNRVFIVAQLLLSTFLLNAPFRMFTLKFNLRGWKGNKPGILFLIISGIMIIFMQSFAIYWIIWLYVLVSIYFHFISKAPTP